MKFKGKDPKVWITTDNFLSFLLYALSRSWATVSTLWNPLRKSRSEQQKIQLFTGLLNGLGQCLTGADYRWCNEILLSLNRLCFLACCKESAGPWHYHFLYCFLPGKKIKPDNCLAQIMQPESWSSTASFCLLYVFIIWLNQSMHLSQYIEQW